MTGQMIHIDGGWWAVSRFASRVNVLNGSELLPR